MISLLDPVDQLSCIAAIGPDQPQATKALAYTVQHQPGTVAVLNIPGVPRTQPRLCRAEANMIGKSKR